MLDVQDQLFRAAANLDSDPYAALISRFFQSEFPANAFVTKEDQIELLTAVLIGTNNIRFGPKPNPESLVAIRDVMRAAVAAKQAIPVLVPWGGRKTVFSRGIDVAEVVALKQLSCLQAGIRKIYEPGLQVNIRIEDAGAMYLYVRDGKDSDTSVEAYSSDFQKLIRVLNLPFVNPIRESSLMDYNEYANVSNEILDPMYNYLVESDAIGIRSDSLHYKKLLDLGWKGEIPNTQREYYKRRYVAHDPSITPYSANKQLAEYFAGSLARYKLKGTAADPEWKGQYIQISFVPPVPGAPVALTSRNIYYRTIPEKLSRNHMPAWRSKGYFKITDDEASPRLASFHEKVELTPQTTVLSRAGESVTINTDYLLER